MSILNQNVENYGINSEHRDLAFQACCQRSELMSSMNSEFKNEPWKIDNYFELVVFVGY